MLQLGKGPAAKVNNGSNIYAKQVLTLVTQRGCLPLKQTGDLSVINKITQTK